MLNELTEYGKSISEIGKLRLAGIVSRVLGLFLLLLAVVLLAVAVFAFVAVALVDVLANYMPVWSAALIMGGVYALLIGIAIACRTRWFVNPFIRLLTKEVRTEQELESQVKNAEQEAQMQRLRLENRVLNLSLLWSLVREWLHKDDQRL